MGWRRGNGPTPREPFKFLLLEKHSDGFESIVRVLARDESDSADLGN